MTTSFNIIGTGQLGTHIAHALHQHPQFTLRGFCTRRFSEAQRLCQLLNAGEAFASVHELPSADITFITTPDSTISSIVTTLLQTPSLNPGSIVVHCSGAYTSSLLAPLKQRGCLIASLHPFNTFSSTRLQSFAGCPCTIEGDDKAIDALSTIFVQLGAKMICLEPANKQRYHAAATMASNYLVTLAACAQTLLKDAGIEQQHAKNMCNHLMLNTLQNIQQSNEAVEALTGPLKRNDEQTIIRHLQAIDSPQIEELYRTAGLTTLSLINISEDIKTKLTSLLTTVGAPEWV